MRLNRGKYVALALSLVWSAGAQAAVVIDVEETGSGVVATTSGSLDLAGLTSVGTVPTIGRIRPNLGLFVTTDGMDIEDYAGLSGPANFGPGFLVDATSSSGDVFGIYGDLNRVYVASSYTSGNSLAATTSFSGETLASLGATPGTYVYSVPNDTITLNIGVATPAVPEPATWATMVLGLGFVGGAMRSGKRRQKARVAYA